MKNGNQPINPTTYTRKGSGDDDFEPLMAGKHTGFEKPFGGLTKREYFAGLAMQSYLNQYYGQKPKTKIDVAKWSIEIADELLKQLEL